MGDPMPKAYWIARVTVSNPDQYKLYAEATPDCLHEIRCAHFGARRQHSQLEGEGRPRNVVIEFPSYDEAIACYNSPEYQAAKAKRKGAGEAEIVIVEGV